MGSAQNPMGSGRLVLEFVMPDLDNYPIDPIAYTAPEAEPGKVNNMTTCLNCQKGLDSAASSCRKCGHMVFPDSHLEAEVRDALEKPEGSLTKGDLKRLEALDASETEVRHLSGIEHAVNLTDLYIMDTPINDISPLAALTKLTTLMLGGNDISDVGPLASLTNLTDLMLGGNDINDIGPLTSLTNLTDLNLSGNDISDIRPLASLTNLRKLNLGHTDISDISPLASLTNLTELYLYGTPLNQVSIYIHIPIFKSRGVGVTGPR